LPADCSPTARQFFNPFVPDDPTHKQYNWHTLRNAELSPNFVTILIGNRAGLNLPAASIPLLLP
jgi:hypothetical protein